MLSQQDVQTIADLTAEEISLPFRPIIQVKSVEGGGRARPITKTITIPKWVLTVSDDYATYYIVHEVCHFSKSPWGNFRMGHCQQFKSIECRALEKWGMKPVYAKAYPKKLLNMAGDVIYERAKVRRKIPARSGYLTFF